MRRPVVLAALAAVAMATASTHAAPAESPPAPRPQWTLGMVGGVEVPLAAMKTSHRRGLAAGLRVAWTSRIGLGLEAAIDYSPLPQQQTIEGERFDTTYTTAAFGPRFAAGWSLVRFALAAGGGVALDHTQASGGLLEAPTTTTTFAPAAEVGLEIELHVVPGGGILLTGGGTRTFGPLDYEYAWAMGGVALAF
jgi:hypothetical protein